MKAFIIVIGMIIINIAIITAIIDARVTMCVTGEQLVHATIRQIMAARAIHNVFKMTESTMSVTSEGIRSVCQSVCFSVVCVCVCVCVCVICQIMAARAIHNVFKMTESTMSVTSEGIRSACQSECVSLWHVCVCV